MITILSFSNTHTHTHQYPKPEDFIHPALDVLLYFSYAGGEQSAHVNVQDILVRNYSHKAEQSQTALVMKPHEKNSVGNKTRSQKPDIADERRFRLGRAF